MLEKPDISEASLIACLQAAYGLKPRQLTFLPLGADLNTAVYRLVAGDETPYFLKLRSGGFDELSVLLPALLSSQGLQSVIVPLQTRSGQLWADFDAFKVILYPFVDGRDGYQIELTGAQWSEFGAAVRRLHDLVAPAEWLKRLPRESWSPKWRDSLAGLLGSLDAGHYPDGAAAELAVFMRARRDEIELLLARAERLALALLARPPEFVLCHSDLHAGNRLVDAAGKLHIVDWDNPILAPKERDLMFIGGAQGFISRTPEDEEALFYRGYGPAQVDPLALAYYRIARIIEDLAIEAGQLLLTTEGGADRPLALRWFQSNFLPGGTIEMAYRVGIPGALTGA